MQGWFSILLMIALGAKFALISVRLSRLIGPSDPTPEDIYVWRKGALDWGNEGR